MDRRSCEKINCWLEKYPLPIGINYVTSDAVNSLEMWMKDTFNPEKIEKELATASSTGFNSIRVFLPFTVWKHERKDFLNSFDVFLDICEKNSLSVLPILFDDCAFDFGSEPVYGRQPEPVPGVHNSRWVPSPGFSVQDDPEGLKLCLSYLDDIIGDHRSDAIIIAWDIHNEPGNTKRRSKCMPLLTAAFEEARSISPDQPLTAGVWLHQGNDEVNRWQLENSDIISVHAYTPLERTRELVNKYRQPGRPFFITEWMHRPAGNTIKDHLPYFHSEKIGCWQWGMIVGKTQTNLSWKTMNGGVPEPDPQLWQHDLLYPDGTPYDPEEIRMIRSFGKGSVESGSKKV